MGILVSIATIVMGHSTAKMVHSVNPIATQHCLNKYSYSTSN